MAAVEMLIRNNHSEYSFQMKLREPLAAFKGDAVPVREGGFAQHGRSSVGKMEAELQKTAHNNPGLKIEKGKTELSKNGFSKISKALCVLAWILLLSYLGSMPAWYFVFVVIFVLIIWGLFKGGSFEPLEGRIRASAYGLMMLSISSFFLFGIAECFVMDNSSAAFIFLIIAVIVALGGYRGSVIAERKGKNAVYSVNKLISGGVFVFLIPFIILASILIF